MFVETITQPREEWQTWSDKLGIYSDPPAALIASIAWDAGNGNVTQLNVWDNPGAVGEMYLQRTASVIEELGEPSGKPQRHGNPLALHIRS